MLNHDWSYDVLIKVVWFFQFLLPCFGWYPDHLFICGSIAYWFFYYVSNMWVWSATREHRRLGTSVVYVLPHVIWIHQLGLCPSNLAQDTQLEATFQILSLVCFLLRWLMPPPPWNSQVNISILIFLLLSLIPFFYTINSYSYIIFNF